MTSQQATARGALLTRRLATALLASAAVAGPARAAAKASQIAQDARTALDRLYQSRPEARDLARRAKAILVFPSIVKAGLLIGGQGGNGALLKNGKVVGFYRIAAASYGLQAGAQTFSYALFFMTDKAVDYAEKTKGWAVGSGPSFVVMDEGKAKNTNTTTLQKEIYAFAFGQQGLMAGLGLEGSKISEIHPDP